MQAQGALESPLLFFDQLHALWKLERAKGGGANSLKIIRIQEDGTGLRCSGILSAKTPDLGLRNWTTDQILSGVRALPRIQDANFGRLEERDS